MNSVFITGISTAGKSYLAEKVARALGIDFVKTDMVRREMKKIQAEEQVRERLAAEPRWGTTTELQRLEVHATFTGERPRYAAEAEKHGYASFDNVDDAEKELIRLILHLVLPKKA